MHGTLAILLLAGTSTVAAKSSLPSAEAETLIARGVELRRENQDADALAAFRQAHAAAPTGRTLAHMGFAEAALRRWVEAEEHLAEAMRTQDAYVTANLKLVYEQLGAARARVGVLQIVGPAGATVLLDGRPVATLPSAAPIRRGEGAVMVGVRAVGYVAAEREVMVEGGKEQVIVLGLEPAICPTSPNLVESPGRAPARGRDWLVGGFAAASVTAIGSGAALLWLDGRKSCAAQGDCPTVFQTRTAGIGMLAAGVALGAATGLALWPVREAGLSVAPGSVAVAGRF